jgi:hypothetical protein
MSNIALYLLPLFVFITGISAFVLWIILLWDAATGISPSPRFRKKNKS